MNYSLRKASWMGRKVLTFKKNLKPGSQKLKGRPREILGQPFCNDLMRLFTWPVCKLAAITDI